MSDPLVRIADEAGHEYQVFKSNFHRLYESLGYKITFLIGDSEGPNETFPPDVPVAPETSTEHIAPPPPVADTAVSVDVAPQAAPVVDAPVDASPIAVAPDPVVEAVPADPAPVDPAVVDVPVADAAAPVTEAAPVEASVATEGAPA